jgi:hypothetical protein
VGELNPGCKNSLCGIHFAPVFIANVSAHGNMAKQNISFLMAANHKQPGGFSVTGFRKRMSELVVIKESNHEAFLPRFGGGSGGDNYICNDGMGANVAGNRHHYQRIRIQ